MDPPENQWLQQDNVLVRFVDDPELYHWRGILRCNYGDDCYVVTPDRDVERTVLEVGEKYSHVKRMEGGRLPARVREDDTYLPKHSDRGAFSNDEMRALVQKADRMASVEIHRKRATGRIDGAGKLADELAALDDEPTPSVLAPQDDLVWVVVYRSGAGELGEEVTPVASAPLMHVGGKSFKFYSLGGEEMLVRGLALREVENFKGVIQSLKPVKEDKEERDCRILPIIFDTADERYRTVTEAVADYEEVDFEDFPLQGPRTVHHDTRQLRRMGMNYMMHHEAWLKKSGVRTSTVQFMNIARCAGLCI